MRLFFLIDIVFYVIIGLSLSQARKENCEYGLGEFLQIIAFLGILLLQWRYFENVILKEGKLSRGQFKHQLGLMILIGIAGMILIGLQQMFDTGRCSVNISSSLLVLYVVFLLQSVSSIIYIALKKQHCE